MGWTDGGTESMVSSFFFLSSLFCLYKCSLYGNFLFLQQRLWLGLTSFTQHVNSLQYIEHADCKMCFLLGFVTQSKKNACAAQRLPALGCVSVHDAHPVFYLSSTMPSLATHALNATKFRLSVSFLRSVFRQRKICAYQSRKFCGSRRTTRPCHSSGGSSGRNSANSLTI